MPQQKGAEHDADAEDEAQDLVGRIGEPGEQDRAGDGADDARCECRPQRPLQLQRPAPVEKGAGGGRDHHRHRIHRIGQRHEVGRADEAEQDQRQRKTGQVLGIDRERNERQKQQVSLHREEKVRGSGARHYTLPVCVRWLFARHRLCSSLSRSFRSRRDADQGKVIATGPSPAIGRAAAGFRA